MNRVIVSFCLLVGIVLCAVGSAEVIRNENDELIEIIDEIILYSENGDDGMASAAAEKLSVKWNDFERKMSLLVRDDKLNTVSASVARIKPYVSDANDELAAELQNIRKQLSIIYRSELPVWYNIF